jgi:putative ABC transport system permease protein
MPLYPRKLKIYRLLLRAYPAEFRHEYGREMEQLFSDRLAEELPRRVWQAALGDLLIAAPREHRAILAADLRIGLRLLAKSPVTTLVALLAMAVGIGATTAVFSLVNAVLLRSFPYGDVSKLVYTWTPNPRFVGTPLQLGPSPADFLTWQKEAHSFSDLAGFNEGRFRIDGASFGGAHVTGNFFATMQVSPALGRAIEAQDDQPGHDVAVISDALWHSHFGGASNALGQTLRVGNNSFQVIGVMPPSFSYPHASDFPATTVNVPRADIWVPFGWTDKQKALRGQDMDEVDAVGRLRPGVTLEQAQAEIAAIEARLEPLYPEEWRGWKVYVQSFADSEAGEVRLLMWLLLGAVTLVLLIACGNVAGLFTAKAAVRVHEMGVRAALGAGRSRLVRQMLTESMLLAIAGGALGTLLAAGAIRLVVRLNPGNIPRLDEIALDGRVLVFTAAVTLFTGVLFGIAPALTASRVNLMELLKSGGRGVAGHHRLRGTLVLTQVALAVVLLAGAGLLVRSYVKVQGVDKGFAPSTLGAYMELGGQYDTPQHQEATRQRQDAFRHALLQSIRALPGVQAAGAVTGVPLSQYESLTFLQVEGYPDQKDQVVDARRASGGYFSAMAIHLIAGRFLSDDDQNVCVVSKGFADRYFPGRNALGGVLHVGSQEVDRIVGVVSDVRHSNLEETPRPVVYQSMRLNLESRFDLAVRSSLAPTEMTAAIRKAVRDLDPEIVVAKVRTMDQLVDEASARRRFQAVVLAVFAGVALFLPLVGLYGLMAYSVKQRTAEIGIRMTLGASRSRVIAMVLRQGLGWVIAGIVIGLAGALALARLAASFLYGVASTDPVTFAAVPMLLLMVAVTAALIPAWNAARINPVEALRNE